jgi:hypothetical protein
MMSDLAVFSFQRLLGTALFTVGNILSRYIDKKTIPNNFSSEQDRKFKRSPVTK